MIAAMIIYIFGALIHFFIFIVVSDDNNVDQDKAVAFIMAWPIIFIIRVCRGSLKFWRDQ